MANGEVSVSDPAHFHMNINAAVATIEGVVQDLVREQGTIEHLKRGRVEDSITADLANRWDGHRVYSH